MDKVLIYQQLEHWAKETPENIALYSRKGENWDKVSWQKYRECVDLISASLIALGHKTKDSVAIIANNRKEFLFAQMGIIGAHGIPAPIYATSKSDQVAYIINHCKAKIVFAEDKIQYDKLVSERDNLSIEKVVLMEEVPGCDPSWTIMFDNFLKLGEEKKEKITERVKNIKEDDPALLIYTSGTTGYPKAVIITHKNLFHTGKVAIERYSLIRTRVVSYLPLSHIAEQVITNVAQLHTGGEVYLCPDMQEMKHYLPVARPNVFLGVPRVWEKFKYALETEFNKATGFKKWLLNKALKVELASFQKEIKDGKKCKSLSRSLLNKFVISKIQEKMGLGQLEAAVTGAAPISTDVQMFFASIGVTIYEVYGMSETTGVISSTIPMKPRFGTVGKPFENVEVKIAEDGEIIVKGPTMSPGYLNDEENTAELWEGGWLHTGDIGNFDEEGNLVITDRKKNLIITAGGKNIAPSPIESDLSSIRGIAVAVVIGDRRKYLTAVMTIDRDVAPSVASELQISCDKIESLSTNDKFLNYLDEKIKLINKSLSNYQTIKKFHLLPNEFSVDSGELTPTMKVKRKVVIEKYNKEIESLYT